MKPSGYIIVAGIYIVVALVGYAVTRSLHVENSSIALILGAFAGTSFGVAVWHRQSPGSSLTSVKLGLGITLAITAAILAVVLQVTMRWQPYPEIAIPIAVVGCFVYPFIAAKRTWEALAKK